ncbi:MAG: DNA cytosine methyltransferase, partial [Infirmifilum sp.]
PHVARDARFARLLKVLSENGYSFDYRVLDAADYGVPQRRRRLVLIAVRGTAERVELPEPDHGPPGSPAVRRGVLEPWRTVRDAVGDLPPVEDGECNPSDPLHCAKKLNPRYKEIIRRVPKDGGSRDSVPPELLLPTHRRHASFRDSFGRLWWDRPSVTITTRFYDPSNGRFVHPEQDRALTLREGARLQTFPDDYPFRGPFTRIARQIGEAFPPLLAEKIGRRLREYL